MTNGPICSCTPARSRHAEFAPAIPRRVAPQQSRASASPVIVYVGSHDPGASTLIRLGGTRQLPQFITDNDPHSKAGPPNAGSPIPGSTYPYPNNCALR
jgi:hypothetical protein